MLTGFSHVLELGNEMFHETWLHHKGSDLMDTSSMSGNNKRNSGKAFKIRIGSSPALGSMEYRCRCPEFRPRVWLP